MDRVTILAAALAVAVAGAARADLFDCNVAGRPVVVAGPALQGLPENCRRLAASAFAPPAPDPAQLARRLDAQEAALARLSARLESLARAVRAPVVLAPPPRSAIGAEAEAEAADRLRDLGQDINRKLDAATGVWDR